MRKEVLFKRRFLQPADCRLLIGFFDAKISKYGYEHKQPYWSRRTISDHRLSVKEDGPARLAIQRAKFKAMDELRAHFGVSRVYPQAVQLVIWPEGLSMETHRDRYFKDTILAGLVYLNDDFDGGETYLEDLKVSIRPERGAFMAFDGVKHPHGVTAVTRGTRYCLAMWFTDKLRSLGQ